MIFSGLSGFAGRLEELGYLIRIKEFADPVLEITEIADRLVKNRGKALLFENTGTEFPVLINAYASDERLALALGRKDLEEAVSELVTLFETLSAPGDGFLRKALALPGLFKISSYFPARVKGRGICQKTVIGNPDLSILPVLKCWPFDGGRFITLPMVHTCHPLTGKTNVGMYRMQVLDKNTTGMHWQLHKTGAVHYEAWKAAGGKMPVSVALGGDPVYAYAATAPLPENIDEYILAGFLRKRKVKLVKCITNDIYVPYDADIVIEGYVDTGEEMIMEGPFGDHTGFYSLAGKYPRFHITCITHSAKAVYPATVVGVPPMEDAWLTKATEKLFLAPVKLTLQPEVEDFHLPDAGTAHNLVIVKIKKTYPGQGKKVISSLAGTGQMMFSKYIIVVSGGVDIRDYTEVCKHVLKNTRLSTDLLFSSGPLDVLDHSSDTYAMGGKLGIDATIKLPGEQPEKIRAGNAEIPEQDILSLSPAATGKPDVIKLIEDLPVMVLSVDQSAGSSAVEDAKAGIRKSRLEGLSVVLIVDNTVDPDDKFMIAWQILANSDPGRDIEIISDKIIFIDGTIKAFHRGGFKRKWPNIVTSSDETISIIDRKWESLGIGPFMESPSLRYSKLNRNGTDEVIAGTLC